MIRQRGNGYDALLHSFISILVAQSETWNQIAVFTGQPVLAARLVGFVALGPSPNIIGASERRLNLGEVRSDAPLALFLLRLIARLQATATVPCIDVLAYAANMKTKTEA